MSNFTQKVEKLTLPVIALGGVTAFPAIPLNFEISDPSSLAAANAANAFSTLCRPGTRRETRVAVPFFSQTVKR